MKSKDNIAESAGDNIGDYSRGLGWLLGKVSTDKVNKPNDITSLEHTLNTIKTDVEVLLNYVKDLK